MEKRQLGDNKASHLYAVTVTDSENKRHYIEVFAHNRGHAERICNREGFKVCDMNMIG